MWINRKLIPIPPNEVHNQPDETGQNQQWSKRQQQPYLARKHHARPMHHRSRRKIHIPAVTATSPPTLAPGPRPRSAPSAATSPEMLRPASTSTLPNVTAISPSHVPMNANRAEHARNIPRRLPFGNRDVIPNSCMVIARSGKCRVQRKKKKQSNEQQSAHRKPLGCVLEKQGRL